MQRILAVHAEKLQRGLQPLEVTLLLFKEANKKFSLRNHEIPD